MVHWIFDDLAIDEYKLSESNILNLCRKIVCYEHNVIGMVNFRRKMIIFWIRSRKSTPKYKIHQNAHHWIFDDLPIDEYRLSESNISNLCRKIVCKERGVIGMVKFRRKVIFFCIRSRKSTPKSTPIFSGWGVARNE